MYTVRCTIDGNVYTADQFQQMSEIERERFRGHLVCESCNGNAYFRKKRKDGRSACFCAKHDTKCDAKSKTTEVEPPDDIEDENIMYARDDQFTLKEKNYLKRMWSENEIGDTDPDDEDFTKKGRQNKTYVRNPASSITIHKTLPQILTICINGIIQEQNFDIEVYDGLYDHIRRCVHELKYVDDSLVGKKGYYWGYVICAESNWLNINVNYSKNPSFLLNDSIIDEFWDSVLITPEQWNKTVPIIVRGQLSKSSKGKYYVEVVDFESIYVHTKKFKNAFEHLVKNIRIS